MVITDYPEWFSSEFKNRLAVWENDIPHTEPLSDNAISFMKKTVDEFWNVIYKDGSPRKEIFFEEDGSWPEDTQKR